MKDFRAWLIQKYYTEKCIKGFIMRIGLYQDYLQSQGLNIKSATYNHLLNFIGNLQEQGKSKTSINTTLRAIEHYYHYLQIDNIALNVRLRGIPKEQIILLTEEQLQQLYTNYKDTTKHGYFKYSNKLILSLIVYQALDKQDIINLKTEDINLTKGTIQVPEGTCKKNSRILQLKAHQIIPLHDYITNHRGKGRNNQPSEEQSDKLFHPNCNKEQRLHGQLKILIKTLQAQNLTLKIKRLTQLKQSRISIWISQYGLRKAQYLAGYKDVGSIEKYRNKDMKNLIKQIEKYHPLQ